MAKKSFNKFGPQLAPAVATANSGVQRGVLEKQLPSWTASFESASKVYQTFDMSLDIDVDQAWLRKVLESLQSEDVAVARWIERFAEVCKELGKFRERLHEEYSARWEAANKLGLESEQREKLHAEQLAELEATRSALESRLAELAQGEKSLVEQKSELLEKERSLRLRELNAEAGFAEQNEQALHQLKEQQRKLAKQHEANLERLQEEQRKLGDELSQSARRLAEIKFNCTEEEAERTRKLDEREHEIQQSKAQLDRARSRLDREWSDLKSAEQGLNERIAAEMEDERKSHAQDLARLESQRDKAWAKAVQLKEKLAGAQDLEHMLGEQSPEELLGQLESLREENRALRRSADQSGAAELQSDNEYLRNRVADLERDLASLRPELDDVRRELSVKRVAATELEAVAREKRVLEQHKNTLAVHIDDLESRIEQLTSAQKTQTPFPAMSIMDTEREFRASIELEDVLDLKHFAQELQHRIAQAEDSVALFYPLEDIRVLLGGLAMSQLHVFQGISGTGKTSLAKAFAKAMGGFCTDIAVQAGWRDRDDLLGHYNAFERRFYEKDCLQALYRAQTPRWQDTCNVILLDEMNLSRPEQYFAEFLSALEKNNKDERLISLSETALPNAPSMLKDGRKILVPDNVWFIGTANHDETTNELADKTYDRAHVMTLPKQDHRFEVKSMEPNSFSFRSLQNAFDQACTGHQRTVRDLLDRLTDDNFTEQLGSHFGLGWGNRFEKQALRFIPVMLATGAADGEALDHLLSTRVMRPGKVTGRYDVTADHVRNLQDSLESFWISAKLSGDPEKCLALLEADIKRKEGGV
ncbi:AAA family ATPase [Azotobacter salinestris]|uniref:AAA family ATPase n=1 Tax=Azotobacter salinestris TaxID=69964 RepID=UPI0032DE821A